MYADRRKANQDDDNSYNVLTGDDCPLTVISIPAVSSAVGAP